MQADGGRSRSRSHGKTFFLFIFSTGKKWVVWSDGWNKTGRQFSFFFLSSLTLLNVAPSNISVTFRVRGVRQKKKKQLHRRVICAMCCRLLLIMERSGGELGREKHPHYGS